MARSEAAGRKPSTYDSYRNAFSYLGRFLNHHDAANVATRDVVAFKGVPNFGGVPL